MAKSSATEISAANVHENLLKLPKNVLAWAGHALQVRNIHVGIVHIADWIRQKEQAPVER